MREEQAEILVDHLGELRADGGQAAQRQLLRHAGGARQRVVLRQDRARVLEELGARLLLAGDGAGERHADGGGAAVGRGQVPGEQRVARGDARAGARARRAADLARREQLLGADRRRRRRRRRASVVSPCVSTTPGISASAFSSAATRPRPAGREQVGRLDDDDGVRVLEREVLLEAIVVDAALDRSAGRSSRSSSRA